MSSEIPRTGLQFRTLVTSDGNLELSLVDVDVPEPGADEVLIRVEAAPINPSDLGLMIGTADMTRATPGGTPDRPTVTAPIPDAARRFVAGREGQSLAAGNEGAGTVVAAGSSDTAQALLGKTVSVAGGELYSQYRVAPAVMCMELPEGRSARDGASAFVNPLTALGMIETMRTEGHTALVHTAAASNLGQMLARVCMADGIDLIAIVRKAEQVAMLREIGTAHVLDSTAPDFMELLIGACADTGATIGFDAVGGGPLAGQILTAMEAALNRGATEYSRYGSPTHKQVYIYGRLDLRPTEVGAGVGLAWGLGGWLLMPFLQQIGIERMMALRQRVLDELTTTFSSHYTAEISLAEALHLDNINAYNQRATGQKYLINPNKG